MTAAVSRPSPQFRNLSSLVSPANVAVVGANDRRDAFTGGTVINLDRHGFTGAVYPVNPRRTHVNGLRCYPELAALPEPVEQVVVAVRAELVVDTLRAASAAGATSAIVVSSGFGEGASDTAAHNRLMDLRRCLDETGMTTLGPSTTGLVNLNDHYVPRAVINHLAPEQLESGPVALISQSGAASNVVFNRAHAHGVRVGLAVATGVQADVDLWDVAAHAVADPRITTLAMLVEDLGEPRRYEPVLRAAYDAGKSVVMLRTGRSSVGGAAIATHTGSLAGEWAIEREVLMDLGVTLVADLDQLWEVSSVMRSWGRPPERSVRLGVIGFSGGEGALIADQATHAGLQMPPPTERFRTLVAQEMKLAGAGNPFDPTGEAIGSPESATRVMRGFVALNDYDACLLALNAQPAPSAGGLVDKSTRQFAASAERGAVSYWDIPRLSDGLPGYLQKLGVPNFAGSHRAVQAIASWANTRTPYFATGDGRRRHRSGAAVAMNGAVNYWNARQILAGTGVPFAEAALTASTDEARSVAADLGYPVVLKANTDSTVHKASQGLVVLGVRDEAELLSHYNRLAAAGDGVVVERAVVHSTALVLGVTYEPAIGPVIVFGSGGGSVEHLRDTAIIPVATLTEDSVARGVRRSRVGAFLEGRHPPLFTHSTELVLSLADAVGDRPVSIDINPLAVTDDGLLALDARIQPLPVDADA